MLCSFKQKAAYDIRISDWSSDVCSSEQTVTATIAAPDSGDTSEISGSATAIIDSVADNPSAKFDGEVADGGEGCSPEGGEGASDTEIESFLGLASGALDERSEEHTSELQSLMRISYAVFCLKKKKTNTLTNTNNHTNNNKP